MNKYNIGIFGFGFIGKAICHGMYLDCNVKIYDKYENKYDTLEDTVNSSEFIFVGVPTPVNDDNSQDLSNMDDAIETIVSTAKERKIIILKSTILPGTTRKYAEKYKDHDFVFNPEFLTERQAKLDFINSSRIVLGGEKEPVKKVEELYRVRFSQTPIFKTNWEAAETVKYMCNCFFAVKISYLNELYKISDFLNVDYNELKNMFLADYRIGNSHIDVPGHDKLFGYGGKCVVSDSEIKLEGGHIITIETLYDDYFNGNDIQRVQSCDINFENIEFKNIKSMSKRFVEEDILVFSNKNGTFTCTKEHLIPIYRNDKYILIKAEDIKLTDELIFFDGKNIKLNKHKVLNISTVNHSGYVYNLELESDSEEDDLFWIEQKSRIVSHNCFPKDVKSFVTWAEKNDLHADICKAADIVNERVRPEKDWLKIKGATSKNNYSE